MIHPPLVPSVEPDAESQPARATVSASNVLRCFVKIVVIALGIVVGLVVGMIIAFSAGLIEITC